MDFSSQLTAIEALIAASQKPEAVRRLRIILRQDPHNTQAWYLAAQSFDDPLAKAEALRRVLLGDPGHPKAKAEFEAMKGLELLKPPSLAGKPGPVTTEEYLRSLESPATTPLHTPAPPTASRRVSSFAASASRWPLVGVVVGILAVALVASVLLMSRSPGAPTPAAPTVAQIAAAVLPSQSSNALPTRVTGPTSTVLPTVTITLPPTTTVVSNAALAPLVQTATALQQGINTTSTGLAQAASTATQNAVLTQTATQQGALGATVMAQQTRQAALSTLPGKLVLYPQPNDPPIGPPFIQVTIPPNQTAALAPDGKHMLLIPAWQITNLDGSGAQPITGLPTSKINDSPTSVWSPDRQSILVTLSEGVYVVGVNTLAATQVVALSKKSQDGNNLYYSAPLWSSDSGHIVLLQSESKPTGISKFSVIDTLSVFNTSHPTDTPVTVSTTAFDGGPQVVGWFGNNQHVLVLQDGYTHTDGYPHDMAFLDFDLTRKAVNPIRSIPSTQLSDVNVQTMSPDGKYVLFDAQDVQARTSKDFVMTMDGSTLLPLPADAPLISTRAIQAIWSPNSQYVLATVQYKLAWIEVASGTAHPLPSNPDTGNCSIWSPDSKAILTGYDTTPDRNAPPTGKTFLVSTTDSRPPITLFDQAVCPRRWLP